MSFGKTIDFPLLGDDRGSLVALEAGKLIPFQIKRTYYIFGTKVGVSRGFHAHKTLRQVAVCVSGKCRMLLDDGVSKTNIWLDSPCKGVLIDPMVWHEMHEFSENCVMLVLASDHYDESDYIRDYQEFKRSSGMRLESKTIRLRLVEESDAEFILKLRLDERYNKYISEVNPDVDAQRAWIRGYKKEELEGKQFYFVIEKLDGTPCGTVRVYDLREDSFCWGSWILNENKTRFAALESAFLVYKFGFDVLGYRKSHFEVMNGNEKVVSFHEKMGAIRTGKDDVNSYFEITKTSVDDVRAKLLEKIE